MLFYRIDGTGYGTHGVELIPTPDRGARLRFFGGLHLHTDGAVSCGPQTKQAKNKQNKKWRPSGSVLLTLPPPPPPQLSAYFFTFCVFVFFCNPLPYRPTRLLYMYPWMMGFLFVCLFGTRRSAANAKRTFFKSYASTVKTSE